MAKAKQGSKAIDALKAAYDSGAIRIAVEPKSWAYPAPYRATEANDSYYAVYASDQTIEALKQAGCLSDSRPGVSADKDSKAYLRNDLAQSFISHNAVDVEKECDLFGLSSNPDEPTVAFYHTANPVLDPSNPNVKDGDTCSYLILSARDEARFKYPLDRLTGEARHYLQTHHIGRPAGEFLAIPIRRTVAEAIQRAHPGAIDVTRNVDMDPMAHSIVIPAAMQHIISQLQHDERFHKEPYIKDIKPRPKPVPQAPSVIEAKPYSAYLAELAPHILSFERAEQFSGGFINRIVCANSEALDTILKHMGDRRYCTDPETVMIMSGAGDKTAEYLTVKINQRTYGALKSLVSNDIEENLVPQEFKTNWLRSIDTRIPLADNKFARSNQSIETLRLVSSLEGADQQHWLIVRAPSIARAQLLVANMGVTSERVGILTRPEERPALIRIPLSEQMSLGLMEAADRFDAVPFEIEETPYNSLDELDAAQRAHEDVKIPAVADRVEPKPTIPVNISTRTQDDIRSAAAGILFADRLKDSLGNDDFRVGRVWVPYQPKKRSKDPKDNPVTEYCLGLKVPANKARAFEEALQHTGFRGLTGRRLVWVGKTANVLSYEIFELRLTRDDVEAWKQFQGSDKALAADEDQGTPFIGNDAVKAAVLEHFKEEPIKVDPIEEAWKHLAGLANGRNMQCLEVRIDAAQIKHMETGFLRQLAHLKSLAGMQHTADATVDEWKEAFPVFLHPGLDEAGAELRTTAWQFKESLNKLTPQIAAIETQLRNYYRWLASQPKQADGSIVMPYLVMPNPRTQTAFHIQQLAAKPYKKSEADEDAPGIALFPQKPTLIAGAMAKSKEVMLVPVHPAFFAALAQQNGQVAKLNDSAIDVGELQPFLRKTFYQEPVEEVAPKSNVVNLHQAAALSRLLEGKGAIESCRNLMLGGTLREEHEFNDLAESREHIGAQQALVFQITNRRDWTRKVKPFIDELNRAKLLQKRQQYGELIEAPIPDDLDHARMEEQKARAEFELMRDADFFYHLNKIIEGNDPEFHMPALRVAADRLSQAIEEGDLPRELFLHSVLRSISQSSGEISKEYLVKIHQIADEANDNIRRNHRRWKDEVEILSDKYGVDTDEDFKAVSIKTDDDLLFYVLDKENGNEIRGITAEELDSKFNGRHNMPPLRIAVYLAPSKGDQKHQKVLESLQSTTPQRRSSRLIVATNSQQNATEEGSDESVPSQSADGPSTFRERHVKAPTSSPKGVLLREILGPVGDRYFGPLPSIGVA